MKRNAQYWRVELVGFGKKPSRAALGKIAKATAFLAPTRVVYAVELGPCEVVYLPVKKQARKA
jgi:hypothetical protein